jgi:hypothetical protein
VDAAQHYRASHLQIFERRRNQLARGREQDRGIQPLGRSRRSGAGPHRPQVSRQALVRFVARERQNAHAPIPRHLNRDVRGGAESIQAQRAARRDSGDAQAPEPDDAGAQQRCGLQIAKPFRNAIHESFRRDDVPA